MKIAACLLAVLFLASLLPHGFAQQEDYKVLPIRSDLVVNLVFVDVDPAWFGAASLDDLLRSVAAGVRGEAKSTLSWYTEKGVPYAPFSYDVRLRAFQFRGPALQEFRFTWRSLNQPIPRELLQKEGISGALSGIHAPEALKTLIDLSKKHIQTPLEGYTIFFVCGENALGGDPIYYSFGILPETGKVGGVLYLNMYGGPWWGRYVFVDICARHVNEKDYPPVSALKSAEEGLQLLSRYVDELIDLQFVKSNIYYPFYNLQILIDVIVIDASGLGLNFDRLVKSFDIEITDSSLRTLTPYNFYSFRLRLYNVNEVPGFASIIKLVELETWRGKELVAAFDPYEAYNALKSAGILANKTMDYKYIPTIIVVTQHDTYVVIEDLVALGVAIEDPDNPAYALAATAAASYYSLQYEGLAVTVAHEIGHTLGLRHPHDDFDESTESEKWYRWIYTDSMETFMVYSTTWVEGVKRKIVREGFYPMRTYWSIFDLDAIDRATISLLLQDYEKNYAQILETLSNAGLRPDDLPQLKTVLSTSTQWARRAVEEFKRYNFFDRLTFKGLGAQLETSFDYAFMAWAATDLMKLYVEAVLLGNKRLMPEIEQLRQEVESLSQSLEQARQAKTEAEEQINQVTQQIVEARNRAAQLRDRLAQLEKEAADLPQLMQRKTELESEVDKLEQKLSQARNEVAQLETMNMVMMGVAVVLFAGAGGVFLLSRRR